MKKSETTNILSVVALILFVSPFAFGQATGRLKGSIADGLEIGIGWAQANIKGESEKIEIKVGKNGNYELELPEGEYTVISQANGFKSSKEIKIKIVAGQTTELNITLDVDLEKAACLLPVTGIPKGSAEEKKQKPDKN